MGMILGATAVARSSSGPSAWWGIGIGVAGFAVASVTLWLTRLRPGKLRLEVNPPSYFTSFEPAALRLRLPLVFHNAGSRPAVVPGVRLIVPDGWPTEREAYGYLMSDDINSGRGGKFFEPTAVEGGASVVLIVDFLLFRVKPVDIEAAVHRFDLELAHVVRRPSASTNPFGWRALAQIWLSVTEHERAGFTRPCVHFNGFREPPG